MFQKSQIHAPIIDGVQYPDSEVKVEYIGHPAESQHRGRVAVQSGIYACLYDSHDQLRSLRRLFPETDEERKLFELGDINGISERYHSTMQFRA